MANLNRHCCFWVFFSLCALATLGYVFYSGWWLPIQNHKHRLRYNQLQDLEVYKLDKSEWVTYNMDTQHITIISYTQQVPYNYQYHVGMFVSEVPSWLASSESNNNHSNALPYFNTTWELFSQLVDGKTDNMSNNVNVSDNLIIIQYSESKCESFSVCLAYFLNRNPLVSPHFDGKLVHTVIDKEYKAGIDSHVTSKLLDDPRDVFQFIIMFVLCMWLIIVLEFFDENDTEQNEAWVYLAVTLFFVLCYFLWIFALSVIPIFFCTPAAMDGLDYWQISKYSLTYTVGDFFAPWWISGVMLHGIWQWCLIITCPLCCSIYIVLMMMCCCKEERADKVGKVLVLPVMCVASLVVVLGTVGFIPLFVGNMSMWNDDTYIGGTYVEQHGTEEYDNPGMIAFQILIGIAVIIIVIPSFACVLLCLAKCMRDKDSDERPMHSIKNSLKRLPMVGSQRTVRIDGGSTGSHKGYGKVAMTNYDVYN